ncbi:uncharacterized protein BJX67DRAFT_353008 [Aspergillus lucknowensis]|uniref:Secreted protein n=1 Tax=Aspergillus lucknowensis TaxID=176173 RepID=A0ABR4LSF7_9EURO
MGGYRVGLWLILWICDGDYRLYETWVRSLLASLSSPSSTTMCCHYYRSYINLHHEQPQFSTTMLMTPLKLKTC